MGEPDRSMTRQECEALLRGPETKGVRELARKLIASMDRLQSLHRACPDPMCAACIQIRSFNGPGATGGTNPREGPADGSEQRTGQDGERGPGP